MSSSKHRYKMFPKEKFAVVYFSPGDLFTEEALQINNEYKHDPAYSEIHFLVLLFFGCNPIFKETDLQNLVTEYQHNPQKNNHIRSVFLVDKPKATAFAHLIMSNTPEESSYCTTFEQAYDFLKPTGISYADFITRIEETKL